MIKFRIFIFILLGIGFFSNFHTALGEFEFHGDGNLTAIGIPLDDIFSNEDPFEIQWFYPRNPIDIDNSINTGFYSNVTLGFNLNGIVKDYSDICNIQVVNGEDGIDSFNIFCPKESSDGDPFDPGPLGEFTFNSFSVAMVDNDGFALHNDELPENMSYLDSDWDVKDILLTYDATIVVEDMEIEIPASIAGKFNSSPDSDGDGIIDFWEINGLDYNLDGNIDLDFKSLGAKFDHKDLFLEIDYMDMHKPSTNVTDAVIASFGNAPSHLVNNPDGKAGINLHIEIDESIGHQDELPIWSGFDSLKETHFGTKDERGDDAKIDAKKYFYRYGMFIHSMDVVGPSGRAELPGNDFVVSLAGFQEDDSDHGVGSLSEQASTLMHELGHTLNLHHGGQDDVNCKPNYLSIMSYTFQMDELVPNRPLDYSRETLDELDESALVEANGIGMGSFPRTWVGDNVAAHLVMTGVPVDYNNDGDFTDTVHRNANNLGINDCDRIGKISILKGFSDWNFLLYDFRSTESNFDDGQHPDLAEDTEEMTREDLDEMIARNFPSSCIVPESGDWMITESCEISSEIIAPANVMIQNNAVVTVNSDGSLTVSSGENIIIVDGSGLKLIQGSSLNILS